MNLPEVHLELREIYRDHLDEDDITVQMAVIECDGYQLWFTPKQLAEYVDQISKIEFDKWAWNAYVMVETYDGERYFVRREGSRIVVVVPDLDQRQYDWSALRTAILGALEE